VPAEYRLQAGDRVRVPPMRTAERPAQAAVPAGREFEIAFEDEALLVVDKPSGMAVHGGSGVSFGVIEQLRRQRPLARSSNWPIGSIAKPPACWWSPRSAWC
jgi:23S rRNA pseudouridine955/2504/2580 synthase